MNRILLTVLALALTLPAFAHDDATLDAMATPHGGQMRMAGPYHFELVVAERQLTVYLSDHADQPIASQGVRGTATVLSGAKATVPLESAGTNVLRGAGEFAVGPDMKVVVSLTFPDGNTWQARFTPWDRMQGAKPAGTAAPAGHSHHAH